LAYSTDTLSERDKLEVIPIPSELAKAVQPFSLAKNTKFKQLGERLFRAISLARLDFEAAGFAWKLDNKDVNH
jgi:hypothetical protein